MNDCNPIPCDCKDGRAGMSGLDGASGKAGVNGMPGIEGPKGPQGDQGAQGPDGIAGEVGIAGDDGTVSIHGPQGPQGPQGDQGAQGLDGNDGDDGDAGARGSDAVDNLFKEIDEFTPTAPPIIRTHNFGLNQIHIMRNTGVIWNRLAGTWNSPPVPIGSLDKVYGSFATVDWFMEVMNGQRLQMNGVQSSIGFNTIIGSLPSNPGSPTFKPANNRDCFTFLYIGDDEWLVINANLAGNTLPTIT